jgi:hypothetical protein
VKVLLNNQLAPITHAWGFLEIPFQRALDEAVAWRKSIYSDIESIRIEKSLSEALHDLEPLTTLPRKELLVPTKSQWVAYFDNGLKGGDPGSFVGYLSQRLKCRGLAVTCVPDTLTSRNQNAKGTYGSVSFVLYAPEQREWLNHERTITAMNDGGRWLFKQTGQVQAFEDTQRYQAKTVKDRFTAEMLEKYCLALGIRVFEQEFYCHSGALIIVRDPLPPKHFGVTLVEARERIGLQS